MTATLPQPADPAGATPGPLSTTSYVPQLRSFCHNPKTIEEIAADPWLTGALPLHYLYGEVRREGYRRFPRHRQREFPLDFAACYLEAVRPIAERYESRHDKWGSDRARTLRLDPWERLASCERRQLVVKCSCRHVRVAVPCRFRWLCPKCQKRQQRKQFKKLRRATRMQQRAGFQAWRDHGQPKRGKPQWVLLTLTTRHSGNLKRDRKTLVDGWRKLRQWCWQRIGQFPFALVFEFTSGRDDLGHLHAHVAALWPWIDYKDVAREWRRATCRLASQCDNDCLDCERSESLRINIRSARKGPCGAAYYLSKYASKGVDLAEISPHLAAAVIAANYGQRLITTSHRFWKPRDHNCCTCHQPLCLEHRPLPLMEVVPFAVWDAIARTHGVDSQRGPPN